MGTLPTISELLNAGVHFGHTREKRHPKMAPYIFTVRHTVHIMDLVQTQKKLEAASAFLTECARSGKRIVFVGTKDSVKDLVEASANLCASSYVTLRWLGGTLTNFSVIGKLIKRLKDLRSDKASGALNKYTKKEQLGFSNEIDDLTRRVGGIEMLAGVPEVLVIIDLVHEKTARKEAAKKGIPVVALIDTNTNPEGISHPVPCNDDSRQAVALMLAHFAAAINEGKVIAVPSSESSVPEVATSILSDAALADMVPDVDEKAHQLVS